MNVLSIPAHTHTYVLPVPFERCQLFPTLRAFALFSNNKCETESNAKNRLVIMHIKWRFIKMQIESGASSKIIPQHSFFSFETHFTEVFVHSKYLEWRKIRSSGGNCSLFTAKCKVRQFPFSLFNVSLNYCKHLWMLHSYDET